MKRLAAIIGAIVGTIIGCLILWLWAPLPAVPSAMELERLAEGFEAEIIRDEWGVPHIYGTRDADTAFGLAYAHAEDDYETIQQTVAATRGVLARYEGKGAAPTDYIVALMDVWGTIDQRYGRAVPEDVKALAKGYAAGLNLYAAQHRPDTWKGLAPFTAEDIIAGFIFKTPFFYGLDETLLDLYNDDRVEQVALDPGQGTQSWHVGQGSERGSNAFAVAPKRTTDGSTQLIINSHQPMTGPVAWYEAHIVSDEGIDMTGGVFPGTPVILHGFNAALGWANTVNKPDLADVYRLKLNPDNKGEYLLDGAWQEFSREKVTIPVKLWGPFVFKAKREVLRSVHGPVVQVDHGTYALRYAGMGEIRQLEQYYRLNQAHSFDGFMAAMEMNALPSINYVYADRAGNIVFIHNGQYPERIEGWDWKKDLPGDRRDLIWSSYRPFREVPKLINPASGFVYNANNTPYSATDGGDNLTADQFSPTMGLQENETNRSLRVMELTDGYSVLNEAALLSIKFDTRYAEESLAVEIISDLIDLEADYPAYQEAIDLLSAWDGALELDSLALPGLVIMPEVTAPLTRIDPPTREKALREAMAFLQKHYGRLDVRWGEVNRLIHGDVDMPVAGGPDTLRAIYPAQERVDGKLQATAGDTWIAHVVWDRNGQQTAKVIHQFGSATLNKESRHYDDQAPLFATEEWRQAHLTREDILAHATRQYRIGGF